MLLNFMLSGTHDTFCYSWILHLAQAKMPCVLLASGFQTPVWHTPSHIHMVYTIHQGCSGLFPWVVFFTGWLWVFMSHLASSLLLILFEAAYWLGSMAIPVGSSVLFHCLFMAYTACLISWLLQLSDVRVHYSLHNHYVVRSVLKEASLRTRNKSVLRT